MADKDYRQLRTKQAELFILNQILNEYNNTKSKELYIMPITSDIGQRNWGGLQNSFISQHLGLERIEEKGLIKIIDWTTLQGIQVSILQHTALQKLHDELYITIPPTGTGARIVYSTKTGRGTMNGVSFKLNRGSRNRKVFQFLAKHPNEDFTKRKIWVIAGEKGKFPEGNGEYEKFNTIITTLREAVANISPEYLKLNKTVRLHANVSLTD